MSNIANPLGVLPEKELLRKFAVPSVIAMLVGSLYNIVDQIFIGQRIGELGNSATNVAFPVTTLCLSIALLCGIGSASAFNISLGQGNKKDAPYYIGNAFTFTFVVNIVIAALMLAFTDQILIFCGSPIDVLPYARDYVKVIALGLPVFTASTAGSHMIRADGSPKVSMSINIAGAVINTILDYFFVFVFDWGMKGAALATIIGQFVSFLIVVVYMLHGFKTTELTIKHFIPHSKYVLRFISLGTAPCFNQLAIMLCQITMNKSLTYYGAQSIYGEAIPLACAGITIKLFQISGAFIIGISQGLQPIVSYNYGAANYKRVKTAYLTAIKYGAVISGISFVLFEAFPRQILSVFGAGSDLYYEFAVSYFRVFVFFICLFFMQPITSNFFTSIGKPKKGIFLSLTRQVLFFVPLLIVIPLFFGLDGIKFVGPVADILSFGVSVSMILHELKKPEFKS